MRALLGLGLALGLAAGVAAEEKLSAKEKAEVIKLTADLEKDPLNEDLIAQRDKFIKLAFERDFPPILCATPLTGIAEKAEDERYMELLMGQSSLTVIAFYAEFPDKRKDRVAMNVAAAESALRGYEAAVAKDESLRNAALDELLAMRKKGTLKPHLEANIECD